MARMPKVVNRFWASLILIEFAEKKNFKDNRSLVLILELSQTKVELF